jgi:amino acid transporter
VLVLWQAIDIIVGTMGLAFLYEEELWHKVLFFLAILLVVGVVGNTATASSGRYWIVAMCFGLMVWVSLVASLLAKGVATRNFSREQAISTHFSTTTGWSSKGYVYMLGWQFCTIAVGADVCAHMSEETQNPSRVVPKAMTWSIVLTYLLGYISIVVCFLAVDPESAAFLSTQNFPVGHILQKAVGDRGAIALCCIIVVIMCIQIQAQLQAASRFVFAMARDRAFPFSDQIKQTNKYKQPWIATCICIALTAPCACLLIAPVGVNYSVVTVCAATLSMLSYVSRRRVDQGGKLTPTLAHPGRSLPPLET